MNDSGSGYLQANFSTPCPVQSGCPLITKETLCTRKLAENLSRQGTAPDSYLPYVCSSVLHVLPYHLNQLNFMFPWVFRGTYFTESRAADQKAGMELAANIRAKYKVATKSQVTQYESTVDEELCLNILEGANFKLDEIRGHLGRSKSWVCCSCFLSFPCCLLAFFFVFSYI
jgi:hypothetical protein